MATCDDVSGCKKNEVKSGADTKDKSVKIEVLIDNSRDVLGHSN